MSTHLNVPIQLNGGAESPIGNKGEARFQLFDREPYVLQNNNNAYLYVGVPQNDISNNNDYEMDDEPKSQPVPIYTEFADRAGIIEKIGYFKLNTNKEDETFDYIGGFHINVDGLQGNNDSIPTISDFNVQGLKKLVIDMTGVDDNTSEICGVDPNRVSNPQIGQIFFKIIKDVI